MKMVKVSFLIGAMSLIGFTFGSLVLIPFSLHFSGRWDDFGPFAGGQRGLIGLIVSLGGALVGALMPWLIYRSRRKS